MSVKAHLKSEPASRLLSRILIAETLLAAAAAAYLATTMVPSNERYIQPGQAVYSDSEQYAKPSPFPKPNSPASPRHHNAVLQVPDVANDSAVLQTAWPDNLPH